MGRSDRRKRDSRRFGGILFTVALTAGGLGLHAAGYGPEDVTAAVQRATSPEPRVVTSAPDRSEPVRLLADRLELGTPDYDGYTEVFQLGAFTPGGENLRRHITFLNEHGYGPIVQAIEKDGQTINRLFIDRANLKRHNLEDISDYIESYGGETAKVDVIDGKIVNWDNVITDVHQMMDSYDRMRTTGCGTFPYRDVFYDTIDTLLPGISDTELHERSLLYAAVTSVESTCNKDAVSIAGAVGPMQVMPHMVRPAQTNLPWPWEPVSVEEAAEPISNIRLGSNLLTDALRYWSGRFDKPWNDERVLEFSLIEYNTGRPAARKYLRDGILNSESRAYVPKVKKTYGHYKDLNE